MFKRRRIDPERARALQAFERAAVHVDAAQRALLAAIPTSRDPGIPLALALAELSARLGEAAAAMPAWRAPGHEDAWQRCAHSLEQARAEAERLRLQPDELGFEALNARVGDVLHPLEAFADAERALRGR
jgi:hypothetical protein